MSLNVVTEIEDESENRVESLKACLVAILVTTGLRLTEAREITSDAKVQCVRKNKISFYVLEYKTLKCIAEDPVFVKRIVPDILVTVLQKAIKKLETFEQNTLSLKKVKVDYDWIAIRKMYVKCFHMNSGTNWNDYINCLEENGIYLK